MLKKMNRIICYLLVAFVTIISLTSCEMPEETPKEITQEMLEELVFEDTVVPYDGEEHSILIDNIYEEDGVVINYSNNGKVKPGKYSIVATIRYNGKNIYKTAELTIEKGISVITAEEVQTLSFLQGVDELQYSSSNDTNQTMAMLDEAGNPITYKDISKPGVYTIQLYLKSNEYYNDSEPVKVTVNVIESILGVSFENEKVVADGSEHSLEIKGELPQGYSVEYENNTGSEDGTYFATAIVKDANGKVVETHRAALIIDNPENAEFKQYLDEFFVSYLEGDQLSVNIFCENPADFGLEHYEASWYTFKDFSEEDIAHDLALFQEMLAELKEFEEQPLNDLQEVAYETLRKYLQHNVDYYSIDDAFFQKLLYIDQFGGYVADFGTYMEAYELRSEEEVKDIVKYIVSTEEAFPSYLDFLAIKTEKGYPLSDYTLDEMIKYLEEIVNSGENYYLKDILIEKVNNVEFLTDEQKTQYTEEIATAIKDNFIAGVTALYEGLDEYKGKCEKDGYLINYEHGKEIYLSELSRVTGMEVIDEAAYIAEIEKALSSALRNVISAQQAIVNKFNISTYAELEAIVSKHPIYEGTPEEQLVYLKEFAKSIVPELQSDPDIVVKNMDLASAKVSNAVAYYMKSALDNSGSEYITLNPIKLGTSSSNDVLGTLAHEGYPGHLYAYIYSKELGLHNLSKIMTSVGHGEGWATYVELALYEYAKKNSSDEDFKLVMDYLYANQCLGFLLESRIDAGIQLEGWDVTEIAKFMDRSGFNSEGAQDIYNLLIEIPAQYVSYGYGKLVFNNLHTQAKKILGIYYDEVEFNAMLLSKGWTDLEILKDTYNEYMEIQCHKYGIVY